MLPVQITRRDNRRTITIFLPETHEELAPILRSSATLAARYLRAFSEGNFIGMRVQIIREILGNKLYRMSTPEDISNLVALLSFLRPDKMPPYTLLQPSRIGFTPYHWPKDKFENGTLREHMIMDTYTEDYLRGDNAAIPLIAATIFRPRDTDTQRALRRADIRTPIANDTQVHANLRHLQRYGRGIFAAGWHTIQMHALHYAIAVKMYIRDTYGPWIFSTPEQAQQATTDIHFGWYSTALQVAETGTFGDVESVLDTRLHDICIYLVQKKQEADKAEEERQRITNQTRSRP